MKPVNPFLVGFCVLVFIFIVAAIAQIIFNNLEKKEPKLKPLNPSKEAFKAYTKPKEKSND